MKELIARAARGDLDAFTELIRPRQAALRAFCVRLLPDGDAADDLAQEVFLAAFQSLKTFELGRDFDTWLRGIARNKIRMALRHESVRRDALDRILRREAEHRLAREPEKSEGLLDEYFSLVCRWDVDVTSSWPERYRWIACYPVTGDSEGHYVHIDIIYHDQSRQMFVLAKTFQGMNHAWQIARRVAELLEV